MSRMLPFQRLRTSAPHPFFLSPSSATASAMSRILQSQRLRRVCSTSTPPTSFIGDGKFHDSSSFSDGYPGCSCTTSSSTISGSTPPTPASATASTMSKTLQSQRLRRVWPIPIPPASFIGDGKRHEQDASAPEASTRLSYTQSLYPLHRRRQVL